MRVESLRYWRGGPFAGRCAPLRRVPSGREAAATGPASGGFGGCRGDGGTGPFAGRGIRRGLRPLRVHSAGALVFRYRRFADGLSRPRDGPEAGYVDAGSRTNWSGNGTVRKRIMRTPVRGRKVLVPGWSGREPRGRGFGEKSPRQRGDLETDQADTGSRKDWARRWDGLEANDADAGCAEESAWQQDGSETGQVDASSRKDCSTLGWSGSAPRGRRFADEMSWQRGDSSGEPRGRRCGKDKARGWGGLEADHADMRCAEESARQREDLETGQMDEGSRKD